VTQDPQVRTVASLRQAAADAPGPGSVPLASTQDGAASAPWQDVVARHQRPGTLQLRELPPLSLYVHLPWCLKKCPYCDFNSHEHTRAGLPEARYLQALRCDLESALPLVWGRRVGTVFIGGGTPSLFSPEGIERLLADVRALLPLEPGAEVTLEANACSFERERLRAFPAAGTGRWGWLLRAVVACGVACLAARSMPHADWASWVFGMALGGLAAAFAVLAASSQIRGWVWGWSAQQVNRLRAV
jgi:hypothetical protein